MLSSPPLFSLVTMLAHTQKLSLIVLCSVLMACGGGGSSTTPDPVAEDPVVEEPVVEEPVVEEPVIEEPAVEEPVEEPVTEQPDPLSTQSASASTGKIAGVNIWQLPNSP